MATAAVQPWYELMMPGARHRVRRFSVPTDADARAMARGLVRAEIGRRNGAGVLWNLWRLSGGRSSTPWMRLDA